MASIPCKSSTNDLINHISFIIDASGSMDHLKNDVIKVFDAQVSRLSDKSITTGQETRVTIYLFSSDIDCVVFDKDVLRLPSLSEKYKPNGGTALMDALMKSITDFEKIHQDYGNHACLTFLITDGEENSSKYTKAADLTKKLASLPDNFTVACLLPNAEAVHEAKKFGILKQNITIWDTTCAAGVAEIGDSIHRATDMFFENRAAGKTTKHLFKLDTSNLTTDVIAQTLTEVDPSTYSIYMVDQDSPIKAFIEQKSGKPYTKGSAFYLLTKKETIQSNKVIYILEKSTDKVYEGANARQLIGLPLDQDIDVKPTASDKFDIYVESTSVNRKLISGTTVLYLSL